LPKTRSGKIMRRLLRAIARGEEITQDVSTLENPAILDQLRGVEAPAAPAKARASQRGKKAARKRAGAKPPAAKPKAKAQRATKGKSRPSKRKSQARARNSKLRRSPAKKAARRAPIRRAARSKK
ncbi:MAG TPA: hypothetical protein VHY36_08415, partial [Steroidobacteraceae bacterium]|nr:hypothetical protein [Steroidobacteraceae bacterium]